MKQIAIYGAGGLGKEALILIQQINLLEKRINPLEQEWEIIGFFDDGEAKGTKIHNLPVLGGMDVLNKWDEILYIILAIGDPATKKALSHKINNPLIHFPVLMHPSVQIFDFQNIRIGEGSIICSGNILTTDITIGSHVLLNLNCTIGHDVKIGDYCSFMPSCNISGCIICEEGVYIGTGAKLINTISLGQFSTIGAGAVVLKNVPEGAKWVGVPAKDL